MERADRICWEELLRTPPTLPPPLRLHAGLRYYEDVYNLVGPHQALDYFTAAWKQEELYWTR